MSTDVETHRDPESVAADLLVLRAMQGDRSALATLVESWHPALVQHARAMGCDADRARDIAQDVWVAATRGLSRLSDPAKFRGWIFGVATRRVIDGLRRRGNERLDAEADMELVAAPDRSDDERDHSIELLRRAAARLDAPQRALISLRYVADLDSNEIGAALGIPPATARTRLAAARAALRTQFDRIAARGDTT